MKRLLAYLAICLLLSLLGSCNVSDNPETTHYIGILAPDTLRTFDTVVVVTLAAGTDSVLDTLWDAPVRDVSELAKLRADHYGGGPVDVLILGLKDGWASYGMKVEIRGSGQPRIDSAPTWDSHPPSLSLKGKDSLAFLEGQTIRDTGATCVDDHVATPRLTVTGKVDSAHAGAYSLEYACRDRAGNVSRRMQYIAIKRWPDTLAPVLRHPSDSLKLAAGAVFSDTAIACRDDRDTGLVPIRSGSLDTRSPGDFNLGYHCADSSGNRSPEWTWHVRVLPWPDTLAPELSLVGPESLTVIEGAAWTDPGATCQDAHDGVLPVAITGTVDLNKRGEYPLSYVCTDSAGNRSRPRGRLVRVVRAPDSVKPVLTMRGPDSAVTFDHQPYADSGAACRDDRDGPLQVSVEGKVDTSVRGRYILRFHCADSAGNAAEAQRVVEVVRRPDAIAPVLSLRGPDSLVIFDHRPFSDPGADCQDDRDGPLPVSVTGTVDTLLRGRYPIAYRCADSAGNSAEKIRVVLVQRMPDTVKPALALRGPDSLDAWEGKPYVDSGAICRDDRDGTLPVTVAGAINVGVRGTQVLRFNCTDSAGNAAPERVRKVRVIRVPDLVKPVIVLIGSAAPAIPKGQAYSDSGATCRDDRDGNLPVVRTGAVDSSRPGIYPLKFACADSAGNAADTVTRMVTVLPPSDSIKPVITLRGPDSIPVVALAYFDDPGADCVDDKDGALPAAFAGFDPPSGPADGIYRARYTCTDKAGNAAEAFRVVKAGLYAPNIMVTQDASIDTVLAGSNHGYTGMLAVSLSTDRYYSLFRFDLSKVNKTGLKSAKIRMVTWPRGSRLNWPGTAQDYSLKAWAMKRDWTEGTGNWFFYYGAWQNGGQDWFIDYFLPAWVKNNSSDPTMTTGVTGADKDLVEPQNVTLMATQSVWARYDASYAASQSMAAPKDLRVIEIDVTDYVKRTDPAQDFGFFVTSENAPDRIGVLSKEVSDGAYATRLMLTY